MNNNQEKTLIKIGIDIYNLQQKYKDEIDISFNKDGRENIQFSEHGDFLKEFPFLLSVVDCKIKEEFGKDLEFPEFRNFIQGIGKEIEPIIKKYDMVFLEYLWNPEDISEVRWCMCFKP